MVYQRALAILARWLVSDFCGIFLPCIAVLLERGSRTHFDNGDSHYLIFGGGLLYLVRWRYILGVVLAAECRQFRSGAGVGD